MKSIDFLIDLQMSISKIIKNLFLTEDGNVFNIESVDTDQSVLLN